MVRLSTGQHAALSSSALESAYPERCAVRYANWQVCEDGEETIRQGAAEGKVVGDLVDGQEEVLVGGRADHVGDSPELEREEWRRAQVPCASNLEGDDTSDDILCQRLGAAKLGDLDTNKVSKLR